jgi:soluble lytic murein transglycosylase-like protein
MVVHTAEEEYQPAHAVLIPEQVSKPVDSLRSLVAEIAECYGLDSLLAFAIVECESAFDPNAVHSESKCAGLFQLNPQYFILDNILDPEQNVNWGVWYFMSLLERFNNDTLCALTAYNYGLVHKQTLEVGSSNYALKVMSVYRILTKQRGGRLAPPKVLSAPGILLEVCK